MKDGKIDYKKVLAYGGAFVSLLIGSGFATGQECMQYFAAYGFKGLLGVLMVFLLFLYVGMDFISVGYEQKFEQGNDIYKYYGGKYIGGFFDYFSILFIYMSFFVMIAGAGATINQHYGLPTYVGGVLMGVLVVCTVIFGLGKIVDILGKLGPIIVICSVFLGISAVVMNFDTLKEANEIIPELNIMKASTNWFFAAASYVGFCMLWLAAFMASLGKDSNSLKEAKYSAALGASAFSAAVLAVVLGLMAAITQVAGSQIPSLILAGNIHPWMATFFTLIVVAGVYTTAVPLLWTVISRFSKEGTSKFRILTVVLGAIGCFVGLKIPFDRLVNIVYVINGYVGIFLLLLMVIKGISRHKNSSK